MKDSPFAYSVATRIREHHFKRLMGVVTNRKVLDCGSGIGYFSEFFAKRGGLVWALDPDINSMQYVKERHDFHCVVGDAQLLPLKSNSFDKILCSEVLEHVEDDERAVSEIARVGKNGAIVLLTVPSPEGVFGSRIKNIAHEHEGTFEKHHRKGYTIGQLKKMFEKNDIKIQDVQYSMIFVTELIMGLSKLVYLSRSGKMTKQLDIHKAKDLLFFKLWKIIFPLILSICRIEDALLSKRIKGHMLIVTGRIEKKAAR